MKAEIKKLDTSEVEITGEIGTEEYMSYRPKAIAELGKNAEVDGFRKGKVPENVLVAKIGEEKILLEMAEMALAKVYPDIIREHKIEAIGRPEITLTKVAAANPLGFKIKTAVMPEVKLPDYKKIAKEVNNKESDAVIVEDKEIDDTIEEIRKSRAVRVTSTDDNGKEIEKAELPELTDEFAKSLGNFETMLDLKTKLRENIQQEKQHRATEKHRLQIIDAVREKTEVVIPQLLIESELDKMMGELSGQIAQMGLGFDKYLEHIKKTEVDLRKDWQDDAKRRVLTGLILNTIAEKEKIEPSKEEVDHEVKHILEHYPNADKHRALHYVENVLTSEKTFAFLESLK